MADISSAVSQAVSQPPADVNLNDSGASVLDALNGFMDRLGTAHLGFLYNRWKQHPCSAPDIKSGPPALGDGGSPETTDLPKLRKLGFGYFDGAAKRLGNLSNAGGALADSGKSMQQEIAGVWQDKAGEAAGDTFLNVSLAAAHYQDAATQLGAAMGALWKNSRQAVQTLAEFGGNDDAGASNDPVAGNGGKRFMGFYGTEDQLNVGDQSSNIDQLTAKLGERKPMFGMSVTGEQIADTIMPLGGLGNQLFGSNYSADDLRQPGIPLGDNEVFGIHFGSVTYTNDAINYLDDFGHNYIAVVKNFRAQIQATVKAVTGQLQTLTSAVGQVQTDPFGALKLGTPQQSTLPGHSSGGGGGVPAGGGGGGTTMGGGGGGTTASSFTPPPAAPPTSAIPTAPAMPATSPSAAGTPETVTVQSGSSTISMTSPDGQGTVKLTVDDGSGQPKTYDVDFGQGGTTTPGTPGATDPSGTPGATDPSGTSGTPGAPTGTDPSGLTGTSGATGATGAGGDPAGMTAPPTGPAGTDPSQPAGADGAAQQVMPGANGQAVIHDGNLTITATEPNGSGGPVQISVDDGSGHPTTYTLDASGSADPSAAVPGADPSGAVPGTDPSAAVPGAVPSGTDPSGAVPVSAMPATGPNQAPPVPGDLGTAPAAAVPVAPAEPAYGQNTVDASYAPAAGPAVPVADSGTTSLSSFAGPVSGGGFGGALGGAMGGVGLGGMGSGGGGLGGGVDHSGDHPGDGMWGGDHSGHDSHDPHDPTGGVGLADTGDQHHDGPGGAGLAVAPGADVDHDDKTTAAGPMQLGGGMGGGLGGGGGGDGQRGASQWRQQGQLFEDAVDNFANRFTGTLDDEGPNR